MNSCERNNSTEKKLLEVRSSTKIDEKELKETHDNVKRDFTKEGIEYGIITLENSEKVKYWFQTHHLSKDEIGGTLFEMPNGRLEFIKGYFCCEVQFPKKGKFKNSKVFLEEMEKVDGIQP